MSLHLLREMHEALVEFQQAYSYVCELHEAGIEAPAAVPRPSKMDPHKASQAANLVSKNHGERNKHTVMAHSMAANAHGQAMRDAKAAGKDHLAAAHKKAMDYHMSHPMGPKPAAPTKAPIDPKRSMKMPAPAAKKPAAPAAPMESNENGMMSNLAASGAQKASPARVDAFKGKMKGMRDRAAAKGDQKTVMKTHSAMASADAKAPVGAPKPKKPVGGGTIASAKPFGK